jgi:hypothetical protein
MQEQPNDDNSLNCSGLEGMSCLRFFTLHLSSSHISMTRCQQTLQNLGVHGLDQMAFNLGNGLSVMIMILLLGCSPAGRQAPPSGPDNL